MGQDLRLGSMLGQESFVYRLILSKQLEVVGDQKLRSQIAKAAAAKPLEAGSGGSASCTIA